MVKWMTHESELVALKRIEGQVKGIQQMIEKKRYCVDIITQLHSVIGAIVKVADNILSSHLEGCVAGALRSKSDKEKEKLIAEIMELIKRCRKGP